MQGKLSNISLILHGRAYLKTFVTNSSISSPLFLLSNICNLVPLRLDSTNYVLWKYQVSSSLKAHSLFGHIDDSLPCPHKFVRSSTDIDTTEYTCRIKDLVDKLVAASVLIEDEEILVHTLNGLPDEFRAFQTSIRTRSGSLSLEELHALLVVEEKMMKNTQKAEILPRPWLPSSKLRQIQL